MQSSQVSLGDRIAAEPQIVIPTDPESLNEKHRNSYASNRHVIQRSGEVKQPNGGTENKEQRQGEAGFGDYFRVFTYTDGLSRLLYALGLLCAIATGSALPLMTIVFGSSTRSVSSYGSSRQDHNEAVTQDINHLVLWFVYLFVARFVCGYVGTLCICTAAVRTTKALRKRFLERLLRQEITHFDVEGGGSVASQVTTNGNRIHLGISEKLYTCAIGISMFFSAFVVALVVQWKLALITMSIVPGIILACGACVGAIIPIEAKLGQLYSQAGIIAQDALGSMKTILAFGAQGKIVSMYDEYLRAAHRVGKKKAIIFGVLFASQTFFTLAGTALAFWEGARLYQSGEIADVGKVITIILSVTLGATSVLFFLPQLEAIANASSAAAELFFIIDKPSTLDPLSSTGNRPETCTGDIEINDLSFSYPTRPGVPVLHNLNLKMPAGKTTALVGPSGCGKSTIVGLLEQWYQPTSGQIFIDGQDIADLNINWLRSQVRLVQQEPTLFQGSIADNVAKGFIGMQKTLPDDSQRQLIQKACKDAGAHGFIQQLPHGYDTQLGEGARMLSGGQRQRIAIARTIVSDPRILLFDEATSALDSRAEKTVQAALDQVSIGKTTLIIAHKLATVMAADNIAVMVNGSVIEQGNHRELIHRDGLYAAMVRAQKLGAEGTEDAAQVNVEPHIHENLKTTKEKDINVPSATERLNLLNANDKKLAVQPSTVETIHASMLKCAFIILAENSNVYLWYFLLGLSYVCVGGTYAIQAVLLSRLIGAFNERNATARHDANFYSLMLFVLALANLLGYFCIGMTCNALGNTFTYRYRKEMLQRILDMDQDFFDSPENASGSLTAKLSSVPDAIEEIMSQNLGLLMNIVINIISSSVLGIAYGWKLGLTLVATGLPLVVGSGYIRVRLDQRLETTTERQYSKSASLATEAIMSIRTVSLLTLESAVLDEYSKCLDSISRDIVRSLVVTLFPYSFSQSAEFLVMGLGFWYGSRLVASGEYTSQQFFTIFIAIIFGGQAAAQFFTWTTSITKATGAANYMLWLRTIRNTVRDIPENGGKAPQDSTFHVALDDVQFSYRQRKASHVIQGISLDIEPGKFAAFVGSSGCGKSTIISLIQRFYDPISGRIVVDDYDIRQFSPSLYRRSMSLVQQEPPLYLGSVRQNVALGLDYEPSADEIHEACRQANILDFVSSLPEGLNTPCGPHGTHFSGGQRQRIAVARAVIRRPRLLLLDEATSALDTQSERAVQAALDGAVLTRTTIAVAHRLSTIKNADVIFVIEDGRIVEQGTHGELLTLKGRYYAMCLAQSFGEG
ncbi:putative ABC transporter [Hortaea werneckii]|nr:putative ABC transporter [Hortaea werneckii]